MKKILYILVALVMSVTSMFAQILKTGDLITVSYKSGNVVHYIGANAAGTGVADYTTPTEACVWVLTTSGTSGAVGDKENTLIVQVDNKKLLREGKTNTRLRITKNIYNNNTSYSFGATGAGTNIYTIKSDQQAGLYVEANVFVKITVNKKSTNYYVNCTGTNRAGEWNTVTSGRQTLRIEKWEERHVDMHNVMMMPEEKVFELAKTAEEANSQAIDMTCRVTHHTEDFYVNAGNSTQRIQIKPDVNDQIQGDNLTLAWKNPSVTNNYMTFENLAYNSTDKLWHFTLKPVGASPDYMTDSNFQEPDADGTFTTAGGTRFNAKNVGDYLMCTATIGAVTAVDSTDCIRAPYHQKDLPKATFDIAPTSYTFTQHQNYDKQQDGSTDLVASNFTDKVSYPGNFGPDGIPVVHDNHSTGSVIPRSADTLAVYLMHQHGTAYYDIRNMMLPGSLEYTMAPANIDRTSDDDLIVNVTMGVLDNGNGTDWIHYAVTQHSIHLYVDENTALTSRTASVQVLVRMRHSDESESSEFIRQITVTQLPWKETPYTGVQFNHKNPLNDDRHQAVHTDTKVIYYKTGEEIGLHPSETEFYGWQRWYDYETDKDPRYNTAAEGKATWKTVPKGPTGIEFLEINNTETSSRGIYANYNSRNGGNDILPINSAYNMPVLNAWSTYNTGWSRKTNSARTDGVHRIACDMSAYTDAVVSPTAITEPTLSRRTIFELRPATEIAAKIAGLAAGKYLEEYHYMAPVGKSVYLSTQHRFRSSRHHQSEMCYFVNVGGNLKQLGVDAGYTAVVWKQNGNTITNPNYSTYTDNLVVSSTKVQTVTYTLTVAGYRIAKFVVDYVSPAEYGPSSRDLITDAEILEHYVGLEKIDFNSISNSQPLSVEQATFGFTYPGSTPASRRRAAGAFPFYGEYMFVNGVTGKSWVDSSIKNHGGGSGYAVYADGTLDPGMVVSISTKKTICSGQQMYCYAWVANANPAGYSEGNSNPIFRFDVQGRNLSTDEWTTVASYFAGEIAKGSGWQQVRFPVVSAEDYAESRVCVYNFATSNSGNDFFVDDICLYATQLPLQAYQANTLCADNSHVATVLRIDYNNLTADWGDRIVYYQIRNKSLDQAVILDGGSTDFDAHYFNEKGDEPQPTNHGTLRVPTAGTTPLAKDIYTSPIAYIDSLITSPDDGNENRGIFYVKQTVGGQERYIMYVAHVFRALDSQYDYDIRMALSEHDLDVPACAMQTPLPIYKPSAMQIDGAEVNGVATKCANNMYNIDMEVTNNIVYNSTPYTIQAQGRADWLIGNEADAIYQEFYLNHAPTTLPEESKLDPTIMAKLSAQKANFDAHTMTAAEFMRQYADTAFLYHYGYTRDQVATALTIGLRRLPSTDDHDPNPNYGVSDYREIDPNGFASEEYYHLIYNLCERGLLKLYISSESFYMQAGAKMYFWIYPIVGSAIYNGPWSDYNDLVLDVCNHAVWMDVRTEASDYTLGFGILPENQRTEAQKFQLPGVRVAAKEVNKGFGIALSNIYNGGSTRTVLAWDSTFVFKTNDPLLQAKADTFYTAHQAYVNDNANPKTHAFPSPSAFSMRFYADKIWQGTNAAYNSAGYEGRTEIDNHFRYYVVGDTVHFKPIDAAYVTYLQQRRDKVAADYTAYPTNSTARTYPYDANWIAGQPGFQRANNPADTMRANYEYSISVGILDQAFRLGPDEGSCRYGQAFFTVKVVPDTLIWRPAGYTNDWGADENWHGIVKGKEMDWGYAPIEGTVVIIPALDNPLSYPHVTGENMAPMDQGFEANKCGVIYLEAGAHILGQELLEYDSAYVDMPIIATKWQAMSAPLQDMYSGDFFVPHNRSDYTPGNSLENIPSKRAHTSATSPYQGKNSLHVQPFTGYRDTDAPYAFWLSFYNRDVTTYHQPDQTDPNNHTTTYSTQTAAFAPSNALDNRLAPGQGFQALGWGPTDDADSLPLRFPKPDTRYTYYLYGNATGLQTNALTRTNAHKFAYTPNGEGNMNITITNREASDNFLFGNPTMAYIDMKELIDDNPDMTGVYYFWNESWQGVNKDIIEVSGHRFMAPMESFMIETKSSSTSLSFVLKSSYLTLDNMHYVAGAPSRAPEESAAPRRQMMDEVVEAPLELMTITTFNDMSQATIYLGKKASGHVGYRQGEDARFISSGIDEDVNDATATSGLCTYTLQGRDAMQADIRPTLSTIPLGFMTSEECRSQTAQICFNLNETWSTVCYFCDAVTGSRTRIGDGTVLTIDLPANHEMRYYIDGMETDVIDTPDDDPGVATGVENLEESDAVLLGAPEKFIYQNTLYIRVGAKLYDATGKRVK